MTYKNQIEYSDWVFIKDGLKIPDTNYYIEFEEGTEDKIKFLHQHYLVNEKDDCPYHTKEINYSIRSKINDDVIIPNEQLELFPYEYPLLKSAFENNTLQRAGTIV